MDTTTFNPLEMSRGISEFGFMIVCSAVYLVCSASLFFFFIKWFVRVVDNIIERQQHILDEMLQLLKELHAMVKAMREKL